MQGDKCTWSIPSRAMLRDTQSAANVKSQTYLPVNPREKIRLSILVTWPAGNPQIDIYQRHILATFAILIAGLFCWLFLREQLVLNYAFVFSTLSEEAYDHEAAGDASSL